MDSDHTIALVLEGITAQEGHLLASDLVKQLAALLGALKRVDLIARREPSVYFRVTDLSHSSPATITLEACQREPWEDRRQAVLGSFFSTMRTVEAGKSVDYALLEQLRELTRPVGRTVADVRVHWGTQSIRLDESFRTNVEALMSPEETFPGAVRGMLETLNLHDGANVFRVYPDVGPSKLACRFPPELRTQAVNAVSQFVEVRGILRYRAAAPYPHEIDVQSIQVFPDEHTLPSLHDLRGLAPAATGDLLSEDFIREVRDGVNQ